MGEGAEKCKQVLDTTQIEYSSDIRYPSAAEMVSLARKAFKIKILKMWPTLSPFTSKIFLLQPRRSGNKLSVDGLYHFNFTGKHFF